MLDNKPLCSENPSLSKEDYLIRRAKDALATDIYAAKSWLITAKSLFPHSAKIQFEAYRIEKLSKNVKEAAKCFSELFQNFPEDHEIWKEIEVITSCLRSEPKDENSEFMCQLFHHLSQDLQHRLLLMTADHSEDAIDHCKLLLLLLKKFPQTILTHGQRLVETLLTAEKHSHPGIAVNEFRHLLACEALLLLGTSSVELNPRTSLRILCKTIEFYFAHIQQPQDNQITTPWDKLFHAVELMGKKLGWELSNLFATAWNRDIFSEKLQQYAISHASNLTDESSMKQFVICTIIVMMRILVEHAALMKIDEISYVLVEAFIDNCNMPTESKVKKRKSEDSTGIVITSDNEYSGYGIALVVKLYDLLQSNEYLHKESKKLMQQMHLEVLIQPFYLDLAMYKGLHHELVPRLSQEVNSFATHLRLASTCYFLQDYKNMIEYISLVAGALPLLEGKVSTNLAVPGVRHLHYLTIARFPVLQYCCRLLLGFLKDTCSAPGSIGDYAIGHALVLMQIDWPQEINTFTMIIKTILNRGSFSYPLFQSYIIGVDILEEITYLWTEHGGRVALDIGLNTGVLQNRRISTRGVDKGVKEEVRQTMRRQAARDGVDLLDELILRFILNEKQALQHSLINVVR